ncbi:MAG: tetratricopeptide repeat protein [Coriobacteriales bacterium]|nr:tetratricopeptide repeat protein [Coriobacteriales bacterium]
MNSKHYELATQAYKAGDYPAALKGFYQSVKEDYASYLPGDSGLVFHRLGNCLLKMRNLKEAVGAYQKALEDGAYNDRSGVYVNLGTTLNGLNRYTDAIPFFQQALADPGYGTPYRAQMGLGAAYTKLGKLIEAGTAFRDAALDESNPDPVKALTNLGATFSALSRPQDAIEAYLAILDFRVTGKTLNKTYERLGQAYAAAGRYREAVESFDDAVRDGTYELSAAAQADLDRALSLVGGQTTAPEVGNDDSMRGFDYSDMDYIDDQEPAYDDIAGVTGQYGAGNVPVAENTGFFTATETDLIRHSKQHLRKERKLRHTGLKVFLALIVILIVLLGAAVFAYWKGFGWPSQQTVVSDFFTTAADGGDYYQYWVSSEENKEEIDRIMDSVGTAEAVVVDGVVSNMNQSKALVSVTLPEGGTVHYKVDLTRDFISWKIVGVDIVFASDPPDMTIE